MARASIASLGPSARRGARGIARVARQDREVLSGDRMPETRCAAGCRAMRARFLLVSFLCANKEKKPRVQGRSNPQLAFKDKSRRRRLLVK